MFVCPPNSLLETSYPHSFYDLFYVFGRDGVLDIYTCRYYPLVPALKVKFKIVSLECLFLFEIFGAAKLSDVAFSRTFPEQLDCVHYVY